VFAKIRIYRRRTLPRATLPAVPLAEARRDQPLTKAQFHAALRDWLDTTKDAVVGPEAVDGRTPWVHVRDADKLFALHADTSRDAVTRYIQLLDLRGGDLAWEIVASQRGNMTAVAYGPRKVRIKPFYLYALG
jgi:hypothetical protein